ncbi:hematopoietic prostaglandin D synthase [Otolemur garnettii]|uniref:hematopoietic prostaglandin D synthase n=1 Tax=Otolemur garnettii TaxID=30611 RepID=UPI000C7EA493|nr:hematopoietic prostaglandin D synthase [Otolemur garnettii]
MPNYKLTYFNMRGRAEIIRYIFAYLDIAYEDHRIERADWPKIKSTLPFHKIPILEVDGLILHQSLAIARYLTKNTACYYDFLQGLPYQIIHYFQCFLGAVWLGDLHSPLWWLQAFLHSCLIRLPFTVNPETLAYGVKDQIFKELLTSDAPHLLQDLDTYLGEKEWFIGNSVTWADFYWDTCSTTLLVFKPDLLDMYPRLVTLKKRVQGIPAIADWIQRRPQTKL